MILMQTLKEVYKKREREMQAKISEVVNMTLTAMEKAAREAIAADKGIAQIRVADKVATTGNSNSVKHGIAAADLLKELRAQGFKANLHFQHDGGGRDSWVQLTFSGWDG